MKSTVTSVTIAGADVTTLRVVWIEIIAQGSFVTSYAVTTLRVVWIEIVPKQGIFSSAMVTTLRVVWIEILNMAKEYRRKISHHLAGGVD